MVLLLSFHRKGLILFKVELILERFELMTIMIVRVIVEISLPLLNLPVL